MPRRSNLRGLSQPLLIVDGDSIFFRAFFALPKSIKGADGRAINALLGAANLILRVVEDHDPRAVVVCFGQEAAHYRKELYEPYLMQIGMIDRTPRGRMATPRAYEYFHREPPRRQPRLF